MVYSDGSEYRGHFINGIKNGEGLYVWPKKSENGEYGHTYIGKWKDDMMNGEGRF